MSRLALAQPAVREKTFARMMISAAEGGGKTETGLRIGRRLAGPHGEILFIDTQRRQALEYAERHSFIHIPWDAPYDPDELAADVLAVGDSYAVILVDSIYHFWGEDGGVRDVADRAAPVNRRGQKNQFAGWKDARPLHRRMVNALLEVQAHLILCCRAKVDYVQQQTAEGTKIQSLGMQPMTDDGLPYEMNVHLRMNAQDHAITVASSRIDPIPQNTVYAGDQAVDIADAYREWCKGGVALASVAAVAEITERLNGLPDPDHRVDAKNRFLEKFGRPRYLRESQVDEALAEVAQFEAEAVQAAESIAPPAPARPVLATAPASTGGMDPDLLDRWNRLAPRLPHLFGDSLEAFRTIMAGDDSLRWKPKTADGLDRVITAARDYYRGVNGGAHAWTDDELAEVRRLIADLERDPLERDTFVEVAFENLADPARPELWTDGQLTALSTWIRHGSPSATTEGTQPDDDRQHGHAPAA